MEFLIISGLSGAGKTKASEYVEDLGYYCVDNMPVALIPTFSELALTSNEYDKVALVTDIRGKGDYSKLLGVIDSLSSPNIDFKILFIEASTEVIIKRYKESRRNHPLDATGGHVEEALKKEIELLKPIRDRADYIVDTSTYTHSMLKHKLEDFFQKNTKNTLTVNIMSFGFKNGIPMDSDIVFDVRFLPNPYYVPELKELTGQEKSVSDYVFSNKETRKLVDDFEKNIIALLPKYAFEGKQSIKISIGCTGGRHRSVAVAHELYNKVKETISDTYITDREI